MARRAAQLGLSLGRANNAETQATRLGDAETAALTLTEGRVARDNCRGFRFSAAQLGLTLAGFACGAGQEAERRRRAFMEAGQAGELNVLHYVYAYVVRPLYVPDYNI